MITNAFSGRVARPSGLNYKNYKRVKIGGSGLFDIRARPDDLKRGKSSPCESPDIKIWHRPSMKGQMIRHGPIMRSQIRHQVGQQGKRVGAKRLKHRPKIITKITNNYKPKSGTIGQAKRSELQKLQNCQNRPIWDFDDRSRPDSTTCGEPPHTKR